MLEDREAQQLMAQVLLEPISLPDYNIHDSREARKNLSVLYKGNKRGMQGRIYLCCTREIREGIQGRR